MTTDKLLKVAEMTLQGRSISEIAEHFHQSEPTIKAWKKRLAAEWELGSVREIPAELVKRFYKLQEASQESDTNANELRGVWLSKFNYKTKDSRATISGRQFSLSECVAEGGPYINFKAVKGWRCEGPAFLHEIKASVRDFAGSIYISGIWSNRNSNNFGTILGRVQNDFQVIEGQYTGVASDSYIRSDKWRWRKLRPFDYEHISKLDAIKINTELLEEIWQRAKKTSNGFDFLRQFPDLNV